MTFSVDDEIPNTLRHPFDLLHESLLYDSFHRLHFIHFVPREAGAFNHRHYEA